jgi:uncharacterized coiled-coil protein SlyX
MMSLEKRISKLEKKNAVLEYRLKEQQKVIKELKPWTEKIEEMLKGLIENPFGTK